MPVVVVPYRAAGKTRLPSELRAELAGAMLADVVEAAFEVGRVVVVADDADLPPGVEHVADPGGGQSAAVAAGLAGVTGPALVVNADLPCATPAALRELADHGPALVAASDGTTNALSLPEPSLFAPLYGPGSAERFAALGLAPVSIPALEHDVDTLVDLHALPLPPGRRTALVTQCHKAGSTRAR